MSGGHPAAVVSEFAEVVAETIPYADAISDRSFRVLLAIAVFLVGWYLSKVVVRLAGRTVAQRIERPSVTRSVLRGIRLSVIGATGIVAAIILDVGGSEILLSVGVISALLAVVLAPLIGSLINGVFVLADRPFEIGDMIEVSDSGHRGFVEDITIRYTKIFTLENSFIVVPNSEIHKRDVINYSAEDERTRLNVQFMITYESDVDAAQQLAERAARDVEDVITGGPDIRVGSARYPAAPTCHIVEFGDDGILLATRFWAKRPYKLAAIQSAVQEELWARMEDSAVEFAYPHRHLVFDETSGDARVSVGEGGFDR